VVKVGAHSRDVMATQHLPVDAVRQTTGNGGHDEHHGGDHAPSIHTPGHMHNA
jgi:hypothetical protein